MICRLPLIDDKLMKKLAFLRKDVPRFLGRILLMIAAMFLVSCASMQPRPAEEVVADRAMAQANALMDLDFEEAKSYTTPAYRESPRSRAFMAEHSGASFWQSVSVRWVKCEDAPEPEVCDVRLLVNMMKPPAMKAPVTIPRDATWILVEGEWYSVVK